MQQPQVFTGVTPEQYARLVAKAREAGINLDGYTGTATKFGVEIAWAYEPVSQELTIQTMNTPPFVKPGDVDARIQSLVRASLVFSN